MHNNGAFILRDNKDHMSSLHVTMCEEGQIKCQSICVGLYNILYFENLASPGRYNLVLVCVCVF